MKKLIVIAVFALFSASSAISASLTPSIGLSGNMAGFAAHGVQRNFDESGVVRTSNEEHGAFADEFGSVFIELQVNDQVSLGIDYVPHTLETPQNISNEDGGSTPGQNNENSVEAHFDDLTTIYAKLNLPLGGAYLKVGYSTVDVTSHEIMNSGNTYGNDTSDGYTVGLGYNHEVSNGVSIRAEITGTDFSDVKANNGVASTGNRNEISIKEMIGARGTISLVKAF